MRYHNISKDDFLNGDGIRAVLFVSGCTHACPECHNPITWDKNGGLLFDEAAKAELFEYLSNDYVTGITFSGGDPLAPYNREEVLMLMEEIREKFPNKTTWCYTGFTKDELKEQGFWDRLKPNIDVLVEGEFKIALKSTPYNWAGSKNQRILRAEDDFLVNTSDPIYRALVDLEEKLQHNSEAGSELSVVNGVVSEAKDLLNPDGFVYANVEKLKLSVDAMVAQLSASIDKDTRDWTLAFANEAGAAFKERFADVEIVHPGTREDFGEDIEK